ncbi:MAG: hypothetical protein ACRC78_02600 [Planktothrix sp.]
MVYSDLFYAERLAFLFERKSPIGGIRMDDRGLAELDDFIADRVAEKFAQGE